MSVLIKGFTMPGSCEDCDLCTSDGYCIATGGGSLWDALPEGAEYFPTGWKYEGCPLVEVPTPHGRLIDAETKIEAQYYDEEHEEWTMETFTVEEMISIADNEVPTVIEAEGRNDT